MPSLRKRVTSYLRQLSFNNDTREKRHNVNENTFVTKYLQGYTAVKEGPPIIYGKNPTDLPNYDLGRYDTGPNTIVGCYSGPNGGLTTVKRIEKHLCVLDPDIDFIDKLEDNEPTSPKNYLTTTKSSGRPIDNTTMVIKMAGNEYCVTNKPKRRHSKSNSLGSLSDFTIEIEKTKIDKSLHRNTYNSVPTNKRSDNTKRDTNKQNGNSTAAQNSKSTHQKVKLTQEVIADRSKSENYCLSKSKSDGNPFSHKKRGRVIKIDRPNFQGNQELESNSNSPTIHVDDSALPTDWNKKSELIYGISDSLYDRNQVTSCKNGDPIADCFGIIARNDSAILAVADGVNWGEKASIAAKSAVHGSLHYLNKTIFNDTKPFENLTVKDNDSVPSPTIEESNISNISNTREVFVCLLRAFNCAHDLILENQGMLTTLTVAVVLPLKQKLQKNFVTASGEEKRDSETQYVCCTCNVGDTLAYVYSQKYGIREITKGSHDVTCVRDMRDALGALGPVDGINPELSNLTLSVTTLHRGDIVLVASDGLTDNFDPNVCKYTVNVTNAATEPTKPKRVNPPLKCGGSFLPLVPAPGDQQMLAREEHTRNQQKGRVASTQETSGPKEPSQKPPVKPLRKYKNREAIKQNSEERSTNFDRPSSSAYTQSARNSLHREPGDSQKVGTGIKETEPSVDYENPLVAQFMKQNSVEEPYRAPKGDVDKENVKIEKASCRTIHPKVTETKTSSLRRQTSSQQHQESTQQPPRVLSSHYVANQRVSSAKSKSNVSSGYTLGRSKTSVDMRPSAAKSVMRNEDGVPYVTPMQRYELQLLLMEDVLRHGISGKESSCKSAKTLCENLVSYTISITSAKRHMLEDKDLYFDCRNGMLIEVSNQEKKMRRKKGLEKVQNLPGKLDHVTVVAYNVGHFAH